jgi:hypothetical protein
MENTKAHLGHLLHQYFQSICFNFLSEKILKLKLQLEKVEKYFFHSLENSSAILISYNHLKREKYFISLVIYSSVYFLKSFSNSRLFEY